MPEYLQGFLLIGTVLFLIAAPQIYLSHRRSRFKPNRAYFHLGEGAAKYQANDFTGAEAELNEAIRLDPTLHDAYLQRGFIYASQSKYDEALADYTRNIELDPHSAKNYRLRGDLYLRRGEYDKARADANRSFSFPASNSERADTFVIRGYCNLALGSVQGGLNNTQLIENAVSDFGEALTLKPLNLAALSGRGQAYRQQGKFEPALQDFSTIIALAPNILSTYELRADIYKQMEEYAKAEADFEKLFVLDSKARSLALVNIAAVRQLKGDNEGGIAACNEAIKLDPQVPFGFYTRGWIYICQEFWEAARVDFTRAIELNHPDLSCAYFYRAIAQSKLGKLDAAIKDYTESIALNPDFSLAFNNRGYAYSVIGSYENALDDCTQALRLNSSLMYAYGSRGHTYFLMGRYPEALADFQKALEIKPDHKFALAGEAIVQHALGNVEAAKTRWQALIALDSEYLNPNTLKTEYQCADDFAQAAQAVAAL